jgi:hypothetical protein
MPVIGYLIWLTLVQAWLDALAPHPPPSADVVDLAQWRRDHPPAPANGNGPTRGRAA